MAKNLYDDLDLLYREIWGHSLHHGAWVTGYESIKEAREKLIDLSLKQLDPKRNDRRYRMWLRGSCTQNLGPIPLRRY